jgi:hypothetical protein
MDFLVSLIDRKAISTTKDPVSLRTTFKLRPGDTKERIDGFVDRARTHLRLLKNQLAGAEHERPEMVRALPPSRYAELA